MNRKSEAAIRHCDQLLLNAAKGIKILSHLNWSPSLRRRFLTNWKRGNPILPKVTYSKIDYKEREVALKKVVKLCPRSDPRGKFIYRTAKSYLVAIRMLNSLGKSTFCRLSTELYGCPTDRILGSRSTHLTAAKRFIVSTDPYDKTCRVDENEICILPQTVQAEMQTRCDQVFGRGVVEVKLDPKLASKAAAGARRIRIRSSTCFSHEDISQLIEHEAFVHSLTSLNGREQGGLKALSLSAPRTTGTQEGLALFAELITHSMDLHRLRRIALRVIGVQMGIEGADFIDIFKFFLASGQNELESYQSTARIFRGGDVSGKVVFTKDAAYLSGLATVHTFMRKSIQAGRISLPHLLLSGRMTLSDVLELEELFQQGVLNYPKYEPDWMKDRPRLVAFLLYSNFLNTINLGRLSLDDFHA